VTNVWLKNAWYVAAYAHELQDRPLARTLLGQKLVLYRTSQGRPVALADRCPHRGVPLSMGRVIDDTLRCTYHGMRIDADGQCVHIPCQPQIPAAARIASYPLHERHGYTWIWLGDAALADPAQVPDAHWMDDPQWAACSGHIQAAAHYQLFIDNLLDLSHEAYLHGETIGNEAVAQAPVHTAVSASDVRVHRDVLNCEPPPFYVQANGFTQRINRWHTTTFRPPAYCLIESGSYPSDGDRSQALQRRIINFITPESETRSHYFWGVARSYRVDDPELTEFIRVQVAKTFAEDQVMLEAQQLSLGEQGGAAFPVALKTDAGPIQARRLLQQLIEREQAERA
jgi:vanillate O-demethylase monooxygenase subunit